MTENGNGAVIIGARHGPFGYNEPPGLTPKEFGIARQAVKISVEKAIPALDINKPVMIISSPRDRTTLTAGFWKNDLADAEFNVGKVILDERLEEVGNFSWELFQPLINGGTVSMNGETFKIDKEETNPSSWPYPEYYMMSGQKSVSFSEQSRWSLEYRKKIESIESFGKVKARMAEFMEDLISWIEYSKGVGQIVVVTHDALLIQPVNLFTSGTKRSIEPAGFVRFGIQAGKMVVRRVCDPSCDITEGNNNADVVKALRR